MTFDLGINFDDLLAKPPAATVIVLGPIRDSDLELIGAGVDVPNYTQTKLRDRHHALAKAIASGMKEHEAATLVGYTPNSVMILKKNPAFLDLIDMYRRCADTEFAELNAQFAGLTKDAIATLRDRLEDDPESFSNSALTEIATKMADRAGFAPVKRTENLNVNMSLGEKLALARRRAEMLDVTPNDP